MKIGNKVEERKQSTWWKRDEDRKNKKCIREVGTFSTLESQNQKKRRQKESVKQTKEMVIRSIAQKMSPLARKPLLASGRNIRNNSKHMLLQKTVITTDVDITYASVSKVKNKTKTEQKECQVCSNFVVKCSFRDFTAAQQCTIKR